MRSRKIAALLLISLLLLAGLVLALKRDSYSRQDRETPYAAASAAHPAGTDDLGRDRMCRVAFAMLLSIAGAVSAAAITTVTAAAVGILGSFGVAGTGSLVLLACDVVLALPWLFLLMMVRSTLPLTTSPMRSVAITFMLLAALGWPACARAVYEGCESLRRSDWVMQAKASGLRPRQIARHLIPNLGSLLVPQFLVSIPAFVMAEANLGALGLGVGEPLPSWGGMLMEAANSAVLTRSAWVLMPIALLVVILLLLEAAASEVHA